MPVFFIFDAGQRTCRLIKEKPRGGGIAFFEFMTVVKEFAPSIQQHISDSEVYRNRFVRPLHLFNEYGPGRKVLRFRNKVQ